MELKPEPQVRADGLCACGCGQRKPPVNKKSQYPGLAKLLAKEPFATTECARAYFGNTPAADRRRPKATENQVLDLLGGGWTTKQELVAKLEVSAATVAARLKRLEDNGMVEVQSRGQLKLYRLAEAA